MDAVTLDVPFGPSRKYRRLLWQYVALFCILALGWWMIPLIVFMPLLSARAVVLAVAIAIMGFLAYWVPRYYDSISYTISSEDITWQRGVWFKTTGIVPYQMVTNIDIGQGPLSRRLGIGSLKVQTAGYSASKQSAEISINGIEGVESLRDLIMPYVRASHGSAPEQKQPPESALLSEVRAIRALLEKR